MKPESRQQQQFSELLENHRSIVFKVASTYCWHADDRAELGQEIVMQLWRAFPKFDPERKFSTWMYRIALNVAISYVRHHTLRQKHLVAMDEQAYDIPDHNQPAAEQDDRVDFLYRFIDGLDALNRALLLLYMEERSYREIADILGITETNVATKINRLKQRIRKVGDESTPTHRSHDNDRSSQHGT